MRKSNVILSVVAIIASLFLLWLWFYLGFNHIDSPLDLVLSIIWWVIIVVGVMVVAKVERTRRERIRTAYVGSGRFYNSETGVQMLAAGVSVADTLAGVLAALEYGFDRQDGPDPDDEENPADWTHVVRTAKYEPEHNDDDEKHEDEVWEGEVVTVATGNVVKFKSRAELAAIIG